MDEIFRQIYTKFQMNFYREIFHNLDDKEGSMTTVETFCMKVINGLDHPTISAFASYVGISLPNATYKVNSLVKKGYLQKERSTKDKREFYLIPTAKYEEYYKISTTYARGIVERCEEILTDEQKKVFTEVMAIINEDVMNEDILPEKK